MEINIFKRFRMQVSVNFDPSGRNHFWPVLIFGFQMIDQKPASNLYVDAKVRSVDSKDTKITTPVQLEPS